MCERIYLVDESTRSDSQSNARSNRRREHNSHTGSYDRQSSTSRYRDSSDYRTQRSSYNESFDRRSSKHSKKLWKKGKLSRVSCVELKSSFVSKRRVFDREVQKAKRKYWYTLQQELLLESKTDQQTFWKKIGKIGIASERKTLIPMEVVDANGNVSLNVDDVLVKWKSDYADLLNQTAILVVIANDKEPKKGWKALAMLLFTLTEILNIASTIIVWIEGYTMGWSWWLSSWSAVLLLGIIALTCLCCIMAAAEDDKNSNEEKKKSNNKKRFFIYYYVVDED
ncbi:unnamed protein product [Mytilus edulis]|uniref:Transmembrane protein n=1 Tax=Mytilus edulis TaxID=6550 RepID=A0A8S3PSL4_MYTED|nr:unnamed protein product [Mytilus edulis]